MPKSQTTRSPSNTNADDLNAHSTYLLPHDEPEEGHTTRHAEGHTESLSLGLERLHERGSDRADGQECLEHGRHEGGREGRELGADDADGRD